MKETKQKPKKSIFDHQYFFAGVGCAAFVILLLLFYFINFTSSLSHVNIEIFSGPTTGNYYTTVTAAEEIARKKKGRIANIATNGSIDNVTRLHESDDSGLFALVQNGMPWGEGLELVAHLKFPETVFFLGPEADRIDSLADLRNLRIGIGPKGSGTAHLGEKIFNTPQMKGLNVVLSYHTSAEQLKLLQERKIDLGLFAISEKSSFIEKAVCREGMQIAGIKQCESIALRLPYLWTEYIREGLYDPVRNLPPADKKVLKVDTLLVTNGGARRSQVMGLLSVFTEIFPNLVNYNKTVTNYTGLPESGAARDFFNNGGPEVLDRYAPRLMDYIPMGSLVQLAMAVSIFFNIMGLANRFYLWRIDANRVAVEERIRIFFGEEILPFPEEIEQLAPMDAHRSDEGKAEASAIMEELARIVARCRKQSQSMLVPMGAEMAYRYQEGLIARNLAAVKAYRNKL